MRRALLLLLLVVSSCLYGGAASGPADRDASNARGTAMLAAADARQLAAPGDVFPLSIDPSGRFLRQADGKPFLIHGDSPWSLAVQLTHSQIDTYLDDRQSRTFNTIMFNMIEHFFSSQSPAYKNAQSGAIPFARITTSSVDFRNRVEAYWQTVDYIVNGAKARNILVIAQPAYLGYGGGSNSDSDQGWNWPVNNASAAELQDYGAFLARRYNQGNVIWCMGGDYVPSDTSKQWNIVTGIRSVRTSDIITAHGSRDTEEAYPFWMGKPGFNLNSIYTDGIEYDLAAKAYTRPGPIPFFLIEGFYDGYSASPADCRRQAYVTILSGGCGHLFGNSPIWGFGEPNANGGIGAAKALADGLNTPATRQMRYVKSLFDAYDWWKLEPMTGTRLVTSNLGSGQGRIVPALASDRTFAMVWSPSSGTSTIDMAQLAPSSVRARFYDSTTGSYSTVGGSPFANSGTQSIIWPGERVLVLDGGDARPSAPKNLRIVSP